MLDALIKHSSGWSARTFLDFPTQARNHTFCNQADALIALSFRYD